MDFTAYLAAKDELNIKEANYIAACSSEADAQAAFNAAQATLNKATATRERTDSEMELALGDLVAEAELVGIGLVLPEPPANPTE